LDEHIEREKARDILKAKRRLAVAKAGLWPPPFAGFYDDIDDPDFDPLAALDAQREAERAEKERLEAALEEASKNKKE